MQPYVILQHLGHQAVNAAAHRRQQHQHIGAVAILGHPPPHCIHLSTQPPHAVQQLDSFLANRLCFHCHTSPGYTTSARHSSTHAPRKSFSPHLSILGP